MKFALTFAIGDIHGCLEKLNKVLDACVEFNERNNGDDKPTFVFLGDYVDRGPDSKGVLDRIIRLRQHHRGKVVTLIGNHEQMMASCLTDGGADREVENAWYGFGGKETMKSYPDDPEELGDLMKYHFSEFFEKLELFYDNGRQFFVHAGVDHLDLPLANQSPERMLWGSGSTHPHSWAGRYVVHGHIAQDITRPKPNRNCINVDTHAYAGGPLSCAVFQDTGFGKPIPEKCCPIALICDGVVHELEVHN